MDTFKVRTGDLYFVKLENPTISFFFFGGGGGAKIYGSKFAQKKVKIPPPSKNFPKLSDGDSFSLRVQVIRGSTFFVHTKFGFAALMCSSHSGMG